MFKEIVRRISSKIKILHLAKLFRIDANLLLFFITINISKLFRPRIDRKLIALGGSSGKAFIGNTKYLYHYLKKHTDYKLVYFVKSKDLKKELDTKGIRTVNAYSLKAIKILRKSRFVFVTHGINDVIPIRFSPKTTFIETWHGILMKKYMNIYDTFEYSKWAKILRLKIENDDIYDYFLTPSGTNKNLMILSNHFLIPPNKILVTGYPRNDFFFSNDLNLSNTIKSKYSVPKLYKEIILYAPTYRDNDLTARFPLSSSELIELNEVLKEKSSILLMKAHKSEKKIEFENHSNIKKISKNTDIQELLFITDILVTDYSSVYVDYLLLNKPIIFFTYDYEYYEKENRGLLYNLKEIAPGPLIYTGKELINTIRNISEMDKKFEQKRKKTNDIFNKYQDGKSTERLLKFLKIIK